MKRAVYLHGSLGDRFGGEHWFDVDSPAQLASALCQFDGARDEIRAGAFHLVAGPLDRVRPSPDGLRPIGFDYGENDIGLGFGHYGEIHLIPAAAGRDFGDSGTLKIVLGVALLGAGLVGGLAFGFGASVFGGALGLSWGSLALSGASMLLQGVASMLSPTPETPKIEDKASFLFNGPVNTDREGLPVSLIYGGPIRVGSHTVSAGLFSEEYGVEPDDETYFGGEAFGREWTNETHEDCPPDPREDSGGSTPRDEGGGVGGGEGGEVRASPDLGEDLQSVSYARIVDLLGEGEIRGLVNGLRSVYLENTPVIADDGSENFEGLVLHERRGTPSQNIIPGFPAQESEQVVGAELTQNSPLTRTITDPNVNACRVTLRLGALYNVNTKTGEHDGLAVEFDIEVKPSGGSWRPAATNRQWQELVGTTTEGECRGLRVRLSTSYTADPDDDGPGEHLGPETLLHVRYRPVGGGSGDWKDLIKENVRARSRVFHGYEERTRPNGDPYIERVWQACTGTVYRVAEVADLDADEYEIEVVSGTLEGAAQYTPAPVLIAGKSLSPYERSYRFDLPPGGHPYDIRVTRLTEDHDEDTDKVSSSFWSRYTEIIDSRMFYPDSAVIGLQFDAENFGGRIPRRSYEVYGRKVKIPANYDPISRTYTGIWDGTFKVDWTNNPAWVFYDLLVEGRANLGEFISEADVDKFRLYEIAQYCDEEIPDGADGTRPRFVANGVINTQAEAIQVVHLMASTFRGMAYWSDGAITATQDKPGDSIKLVTAANVEDGLINYAASGLKARYSVAAVRYNEPDDNYQQAVTLVTHDAARRAYGYRVKDLTAFMCTSRSQARALGRWFLDTGFNEKETISYRASVDHADVAPGDLIDVADPHYSGRRLGGRVAAVDGATVTLDAAVKLDSGDNEISIVTSDDRIVTYAIDEAGITTDTVTAEEAVDAGVLPGAMFIISTSSAAPRPFRVLAVREVEKRKFQVDGLFHDATKFARIEKAENTLAPSFTYLTIGPLSAPANLETQRVLTESGGAIRVDVALSWTASPDPRARFYQVQRRAPGATRWSDVGTVKKLSARLPVFQTGEWGFRVRALADNGRPSSWLTVDPVTIAVSTGAPADVTGFDLDGVGTTGTLQWDAITDLAVDHLELRFQAVTDGSHDWSNGLVMRASISRGTTLLSVPLLSGTYMIKAVGAGGTTSENAAAVVSTIGSLEGFNAVETVTEDSAWAGTHTQTVYDAGAGGLRLDDDPGGGVYESGTYAFAGDVDLGQVYTSRVSADISIGRSNLDADFFAPANFFGPADFFQLPDDEATVALEVRTTNDDPTGSPTWSTWRTLTVAQDFTARALEFRLQLARGDSESVTPVISAASVTVDMPDRTAGAENVTSSVGGTSISISPAFKAVPAVAITASDMNQGDYWRVTNVARDGFDVEFFDSGGTSVSRTFDWIARAWGSET